MKGFTAKCNKSNYFKLTSVFHPQSVNGNLYMIFECLKNAISKQQSTTQARYVKAKLIMFIKGMPNGILF